MSMPSKRKKLIILDGNSLLHRAWHAMPPLTTKDGTVVNAAYGFALAIDKILREHRPEYMAVAWDLPGKTFRHEAVETYKATRVKQPQELYDQIPICKEILEGYGIPSLEAAGYEADDVIGTVSNLEERQGFDTLIVTGDLDALQLVDQNTHVLFFVKGLSKLKEYDPAAVKERYGFGPEKLIDFKAMKGDTSDNVKGVPGVGDKTAAELIEKFGTLENMYKKLEYGKLEEIKENLAEKLLAHKEDALESKMLVTIIRDVKMKFKIDDAELARPDTKALLELYRELEFRTLIRRLGDDTPPPPLEGPGTKATKKQPKLHLPKEHVAILALKQDPYLFGNTLAGIGILTHEGYTLFKNPGAGTRARIFETLQRVSHIATHDFKDLLHVLSPSPRDLPMVTVFDTMLASYLLHPGSRAHDLASVVKETLGETVPELVSLGTKKEEDQLEHLVRALPRMEENLASTLKQERLASVYETLDVPLVPILYRMEKKGIELDRAYLDELRKMFQKTMATLTKNIHELAGEEFNINSPTQLQVILFERLGLPTKGIKKTKTGLSTAASELEKLHDAHPLIPLLEEYREISKLQSTYVESLPNLVGADGRVHTTFHQHVAATGRLSSVDPNLQNIPIRTELGREIRKAFVAGRGKQLVAADYSQIELRIAAVISKDKAFLRAFKEGADIHTRTAAEVLGIDEKDVTKDQRRVAKAINFGILYGMGPHALARQTGFTFQEAKDFIARYFEVHDGIKQFIDEVKIRVRQDGYVETLSGRRRYLPEIHSGVPMLVAAAERMAVNMPAQGTEADILKMAMIEVQKWIDETYPSGGVDLLLQVNDELVFEVDTRMVKEVAQKLRSLMEGVVSYEIPLQVDVSAGKNWKDLQEIK